MMRAGGLEPPYRMGCHKTTLQFLLALPHRSYSFAFVQFLHVRRHEPSGVRLFSLRRAWLPLSPPGDSPQFIGPARSRTSRGMPGPGIEPRLPPRYDSTRRRPPLGYPGMISLPQQRQAADVGPHLLLPPGLNANGSELTGVGALVLHNSPVGHRGRHKALVELL